MRLYRSLRVVFALLMTLMLPMQGYAAVPDCGHRDHHCATPGAVTHHHDCGTCCCGAALALTPVPWVAPLRAVAERLPAVLSSSPTVMLDRLDRPPRPA